jgi:hypothetical protein
MTVLAILNPQSSMNACRLQKATWGLCSDAVCKTASTPLMHRFTNDRSVSIRSCE